ncbi:unnamed protein product [Wickerhamomyces anomalus]
MNNLFPVEKSLDITPETRPLTQTGSIQVYLQLAEPNLFVQGFEPHEYQERPPTILRGSLVLRVLKSSKIRNITLTFKGISKTEWPEGIPPKRQDYVEENDLLNHTWPFYNHANDHNQSGADIVKNSSDSNLSIGNLSDDMSSLNLDSASIMSSTNAFNIIKRATSPSPGRHRSNSLLASLKATATNNSNDSNNINNTTTDPSQHFVFHPGDYIYNFEHAIPASTPESIDATFGSVSYSLNVMIERIGAFKSNIATTLPVRIIRAQSEESVEDSEPIAISRDWEDQLHYDIVIATKAIILNAYIPVAFKLVPLDKIKLHRIRIYLTENLEYYCRNKKVHRMEPVKKYLLLEHKAPPPPDLPPDADAKAKKMGNLLTSDGYDVTAKEFEFQVYVPQKLNNRQNLHPNTSYANIKAHHWIKICLRLSRLIDGKPKHYEISIDSPIHVLHPLCSHANTLLPAYGVPPPSNQLHDSNVYFPKEILNSPPLSPEVEPIDNTYHNIELTSPQAQPVSPSFSPSTRPIHLIRRPSFEPPPFDADISPPPMRDLLQEGVQGLDAAVMDNAPKDPPTYNDFLKEEAKSPAPTLTFTNSTPSPPLVPTDERTPRQLKKSDAKKIDDEEEEEGEGDIAGSFRFRGSSPNMPASVARATSPDALRIRSSARSGRSSTGTSPRTSLDVNSTGSFSNNSNSTLSYNNNSQQNDIDTVIRQSESTSSELINDEVAQFHPQQEIVPPMDEEQQNQLSNNSGRNLSKSSLSSMSPTSLRSLQIDSEAEIVDMEPLLHSTTTNTSFNPPTSSSYQESSQIRRPSTYRAPSIYDQLQSRESLGLVNESSSVDITALYSTNESNIWHPLNDETTPIRSYTPTAVDTGKVLNNFKSNLHQPPPVFKRNMSFGVQTTNPILATLDDDEDEDSHGGSTTEESSPTVSQNNNNVVSSEESSLENNNSSSTITSGNVNEDVLNKHINQEQHFLENHDEQVK